jgi:hypothetical protein
MNFEIPIQHGTHHPASYGHITSTETQLEESLNLKIDLCNDPVRTQQTHKSKYTEPEFPH